jgi:glutamate:GABA antiporter
MLSVNNYIYNNNKGNIYMGKAKKNIGVLTLVAINILAIDSLRNIPLTAPAGWSIIVFYIIGAAFMFVPCAIATAELTSKWPVNGGLSCWVETSLGKNTSFFVVWMQWVYNLVWFPSITAFAATHLAYSVRFAFGEKVIALSDSPLYVFIVSVSIFLLATYINTRGMKIVSVFSFLGAILGKMLPMLLIVVLAAFWLITGHPVALQASSAGIHPESSGIIGLFVVVLFSLMGIEMASSHAGAVKNPKKNFPLALWITVLLIPISLILANLAIDIVVPAGQIDSRAGLMQSFEVFFNAFNISWMNNIIAISLFIGAFAGSAVWAFGLSRYLRKVASDGFMPKFLSKTNKYNVPENALYFQAVVFIVLCFLFLCMPDIKSAYWLFSDLTAQLALIAYVIFFIAAIKLRLTHNWDKGDFKVAPKFVSISMYVVGLLTCLAGIIAGFVLPDGSAGMSAGTFDSILLSGILLFLIIPVVIIFSKKRKLRNSRVPEPILK